MPTRQPKICEFASASGCFKKNGPPIHKSDVDKTIVVGGLDELRMLQKATQWSSQKLKEWEGPKHVGTYIKSANFQGVMFAKFSTIYDRDITAALLRSANVREGGKRIWATQDLPIPVRARKSFLLGLRWQLGDWGLMKNQSSIDDMYGTMTSSGRNVVKVRCEKGELFIEWADDWSAWEELQTSPEVESLATRARTILSKAGKGSGKSKGSDPGL